MGYGRYERYGRYGTDEMFEALNEVISVAPLTVLDLSGTEVRIG